MLAAAYGKRGADVFRVGYVAGLAHFLSLLYWLMLMPVTGLPILGWLALCAYLALYPAVWLWLVAPWDRHSSEPQFRATGLPETPSYPAWSSRLLWSLGGAAVWVALEMLRARLFTGFPWNFIGDSQYRMVPLIQIASVTGVYGLSFLVVWVSLSLYSAASMVLRRPNTRLIWQGEIILPFAVVVGLFVFGFARMNMENPSTSVLRVTLVQPSVPQTLIWDPDENERRFQQLLVQSQTALTNQTDLLVWPESAVPEMDVATCQAISQFALSNRVWIVLNGEDAEFLAAATNYFNAAWLVAPDGRLRQVYHKRVLVVFGEYIPLVRWLPFIKYLTPISDGWTPGNQSVQFEINPLDERAGESVIELNNGSSTAASRHVVKTSPLICFEDTFPGLARDAAHDDTDFLVNLTNDGWFQQSAEQWQHMANALFRAVENGLPLVRCANNGITCWIDDHGRERDIFQDANGSVYGMGAMTIELPVGENRVPTFYHRHGDWFGWGCVGIALAVLARRLFRRTAIAPVSIPNKIF
jgi:apolipoprotein N-acyltransferase